MSDWRSQYPCDWKNNVALKESISWRDQEESVVLSCSNGFGRGALSLPYYGGKLSKKHNLPTSRTTHLTMKKLVARDEARRACRNSLHTTQFEAKRGSPAGSLLWP